MSNPTAAISSAAYPGSFAIKYPIARIAALPTICRAIQGNNHHDAFTNRTYAAFLRSKSLGRCKKASSTSTLRSSDAAAST